MKMHRQMTPKFQRSVCKKTVVKYVQKPQRIVCTKTTPHNYIDIVSNGLVYFTIFYCGLNFLHYRDQTKKD